jgi:WD40 repeat protein
MTLDDDGASGPLGVEIGAYEVIDELGRGGMGVVYLARQRTLDRLVAIKVLAGGAYAGAAVEERFLREARNAARLHHPHIVAIHEIGRHEGRPFYSMDLVEGEDLAVYAARRRPSPRESALLVAKVARAVQHAHGAGVLHRDLKPANVLIDAAGEPHLTDFGLAVAIEGSAELTRTGEVLGSPSYMAPEQLRGEAVAASDVYGLGAILYSLLTGRPPFVAAQLPGLIAAIAQGDPVPLRRIDASLPRDLETIALRALAREPAGRYASAAALADDLERWLEGRPIRARPIATAERVWRWARRNRALAVLATGLALTVVLGVAGIFSQWRRAERAAAKTTLNLYSADLKLASDAALAGNLGLARRRLEACPVGLRDTAWGLLWPFTRGDIETDVGRARGTVTHLAISPDGKWAADTAQADDVRLWDLATGTPAGELAGTDYGWWAEFSPDGRQLFTAARTVKQWDFARRTVIREFPGQSGALSPGGDLLYTCEGQRFVFEGDPGGVSAWRVSDGRAVFKIPIQGRIVAASPDGRMLAVSDAEHAVMLYDARDGRAVGGPWPSLGRVWSLAFSPDSTYLAASGWSAEVRVWTVANPAETAPVARLLKHPLFTWDAAFSSDGTMLAVACSDGQVHVWNTQTWRETRTLRGHDNEVWSLAWQPDGRLLSAGRDPRLLRMTVKPPPENGRLRHDPYSYDIVWLDGGRIATVRDRASGPFAEIARVRSGGDPVRFAGEVPLAFDARAHRLWLWTGGSELRAREDSDWQDVARVSLKLRPGESLAGAPGVIPTAGRAWAALADGSLTVHRLEDGRRVARFGGVFVHPAAAAALAPDGRYFVWGGASSELFLLDLGSGRRRALEGLRYAVSSLVFAPDGRTFFSGGEDGLIIAWDARSGRRLGQLGRHGTSVGRLAISPDGRVVFSQEPGVGIHLWHPATGRKIGFLPAAGSSGAQWLGLSPDNRWFGYRQADGTIKILPVASPLGEMP